MGDVSGGDRARAHEGGEELVAAGRGIVRTPQLLVGVPNAVDRLERGDDARVKEKPNDERVIVACGNIDEHAVFIEEKPNYGRFLDAYSRSVDVGVA